MIKKINDRVSVFFTEEGFGKSNAILIEDDVRIMIDSGPGKIISEADPANIDILLNSHFHIDHIWDNDLFVNARILAHPLESENLKNRNSLGALDRWDDFMAEDPASFYNVIPFPKKSFLEEWSVSGPINEGDIIDSGHTKIEVLHMPGHTSGHMAFMFPEEELLFCGDICLTKVGPWYGDLSTPVDVFLDSIDRIIEMNPERVVSGHNKEVLTSNIKDVFREYGGRIRKRDDRILNAIKERPCSIDELASMKIIYPAHPSILVLYWEKSMIIKHVEGFIRQGLAEQLENGMYIAR